MVLLGRPGILQSVSFALVDSREITAYTHNITGLLAMSSTSTPRFKSALLIGYSQYYTSITVVYYSNKKYIISSIVYYYNYTVLQWILKLERTGIIKRNGYYILQLLMPVLVPVPFVGNI